MHAGQRTGGGRVDAVHQRVRVRAAHERRLQHLGKAQVVDEAAAALQQRVVLDACDGTADELVFRHAVPWAPVRARCCTDRSSSR